MSGETHEDSNRANRFLRCVLLDGRKASVKWRVRSGGLWQCLAVARCAKHRTADTCFAKHRRFFDVEKVLMLFWYEKSAKP